MVLPDLIVIGAVKCGTTSLYRYLNLHPDIHMSAKKELDFFRLHWQKGISWYQTHFKDGMPLNGEASPHYTHVGGDVSVATMAQRMASIVPRAKLIYLVRDPISRIISEYRHSVIYWRERRHLHQLVNNPEESVTIQSTRYFAMIDHYRRHYADEQILVVETEALQKTPETTMAEVFAFLEVNAVPLNKAELQQHHNVSASKSYLNGLGRFLGTLPKPMPKLNAVLPKAAVYTNTPPVLSGEARLKLCDYLRDDIQRFRVWSQRDFAHWSI